MRKDEIEPRFRPAERTQLRRIEYGVPKSDAEPSPRLWLNIDGGTSIEHKLTPSSIKCCCYFNLLQSGRRDLTIRDEPDGESRWRKRSGPLTNKKSGPRARFLACESGRRDLNPRPPEPHFGLGDFRSVWLRSSECGYVLLRKQLEDRVLWLRCSEFG